MWFLFGEVSSSSGYLGCAALFYCGTRWAFNIIISKDELDKLQDGFDMLGELKDKFL